MNQLDKVYQADCVEAIKAIPDDSVDCILTDPPYLYLKNQKLDRPFDENVFFAECKRVLKKDGFIVLFGRGTSFYRWNTILAELGFKFKEEIIWDKRYTSSPVLPISRVHETISIHCLSNRPIYKNKVEYIESKGHDLSSIIQDINRIKTVFNNTSSFDILLNYLQTMKRSDYKEERYATTYATTFSSKRLGNRVVNIAQSIISGMNEKSIIRINRDHLKTVHPTQKPVRLLERLISLVTQPGDVVLDTFAGSCSTAIACINTSRHFICYEIDEEYYQAGFKRVKNALIEPKLDI